MRMQWDDLTMVHWRYEAAQVQSLLPEGVTVDVFDGSAWVGLVPFRMTVDIPGAPPVHRVLRFAETNVRTYVRGVDGDPGVWFFSLEASSLPSVVTARAAYGVPYFWSEMSIDQTGARRRYTTTRRRWPRPAGGSSVVEIEIGDRVAAHDLGELDHFLTARWALFGRHFSRLTYARMFHEPWPLHRAELVECEDELIAAAGLPDPTGETLVHYSPGVNVRCGWPRYGLTDA